MGSGGSGRREEPRRARLESVRYIGLGLLVLSGCASRQHLGAVPSMSSTITRQVTNAVDLGDGDLEIRELRKRLGRNPDDLDARLKLAERYRQAGSPELWIEHYRLAAERFPQNVAVAMLLAKALQDPAVLVDFCHRNSAPPPELLSLLGTLRDDAGQFAAAEGSYREALAHHPQLAYLHNNLGYNLLLQGKAKEAVPEFEAALAIEPHSQFANNNLGLALLAQWTDDSQPQQALLHWQSVSGPATAHNNLATVLIRQHRYPEARQELEIALGYQRNHPAALQNLELLTALDDKPVVPTTRNSFWQRVTKVFGTKPKSSSTPAPVVESASK